MATTYRCTKDDLAQLKVAFRLALSCGVRCRTSLRHDEDDRTGGGLSGADIECGNRSSQLGVHHSRPHEDFETNFGDCKMVATARQGTALSSLRFRRVEGMRGGEGLSILGRQARSWYRLAP